MSNITGQAASTAKNLTNNAEATADGLVDRVQHTLHDAGGKLGDLKDTAQKSLGHSVDTIGSVLKNHPFAAVAIAAGAGIGLGILIAGSIRRA